MIYLILSLRKLRITKRIKKELKIMDSYEKELIESENEKIEYVPMYQKYLADEIMRAKGIDRTMAEFAAVCGVSPTTFSRIANGTIAKPLDKDLIAKIVENTANQDVTYRSLMRANGMVPKSDDTPTRQLSRKRREDEEKRKKKIESIIAKELFDRGYTISKILRTDHSEAPSLLKTSRFGRALNFRLRFGLRIIGFAPEYWYFSNYLYTVKKHDDPERYKRMLSIEVNDVLYDYVAVFLRDIWEPEAFENSKYSIVMIDKGLFDEFLQLIEGVKFKNEFSLILVDLEKEIVIEEKILPRYDDQATGLSLFDKEQR